MESKYLIKCPECSCLRPKTNQHRIRKMNGTILSPRNKKVECKECQNFFDDVTEDTMNAMTSEDFLLPNKEIKLGDKPYYLENHSLHLAAGCEAILPTGSQVQSAIGGMFGTPYSGEIGIPVSLEFVDGAPVGKDKIKVINKTNYDGTIYVSTIVDKQV